MALKIATGLQPYRLPVKVRGVVHGALCRLAKGRGPRHWPSVVVDSGTPRRERWEADAVVASSAKGVALRKITTPQPVLSFARFRAYRGLCSPSNLHLLC